MFLVLFVVGAGLPVGAQDGATVPASRITPAIALARLCVSEANWDCFANGDGLGIHEVLLRGAAHSGVRYVTFARMYARRLFGDRTHDIDRLRWVGQLTPACTEPANWPEVVTRRRRDGSVDVERHAPWRAFRARCHAVFERAEEVVATMTLDNVDDWAVCERPIHDWGGGMDRARAERIGLVPVACRVDTSNDFYCRPSVDPACVEVDRD
jgi:hypothetical protein